MKRPVDRAWELFIDSLFFGALLIRNEKKCSLSLPRLVLLLFSINSLVILTVKHQAIASFIHTAAISFPNPP